MFVLAQYGQSDKNRSDEFAAADLGGDLILKVYPKVVQSQQLHGRRWVYGKGRQQVSVRGWVQSRPFVWGRSQSLCRPASVSHLHEPVKSSRARLQKGSGAKDRFGRQIDHGHLPSHHRPSFFLPSVLHELDATWLWWASGREGESVRVCRCVRVCACVVDYCTASGLDSPENRWVCVSAVLLAVFLVLLESFSGWNW
jgi:hypothetical protein